MKAALAQAELAAQAGEIPIGAIIVQNQKIIASAHNLKETNQMVLCHAEMLVIQQAETILNRMYLDDCDLYVTLEPCMMCAGAINAARIRRLYYGASSKKSGSIETLIKIKSIPYIQSYPKEIYAGLLEKDCAGLLKEFFKEKRNANHMTDIS